MFCKQCGTQNPDNAYCCSNCGVQFSTARPPYQETMKYCQNCGSVISEQAVICPKCGVSQQTNSIVEDSGSAGWGVLGFFIPLAGLILYLVWKDTKPKASKAAGRGALISVCTTAGLYLIYGIIMAIVLSSGALLY